MNCRGSGLKRPGMIKDAQGSVCLAESVRYTGDLE